MPVPRRTPVSQRARRLKVTALSVCVLLAVIATLLGLRSPMVHQYEYQEDIYLSLDGRASVYVSASLPALVALHGMDLSPDPKSLIDRAKIRQAFTGPGVNVSAISAWRRWGRRFITVRLDTADIRRLTGAPPFAAAAFDFRRAGTGYRLIVHLGATVNRPVGTVGWTGSELVGFRWHLPSRVERYNTPEENFLRGNILVWEQPLTSRLAGVPLRMEVYMEGRTILYSALWLFLTSAALALVAVALLVAWVVRGRKPPVMTSR